MTFYVCDQQDLNSYFSRLQQYSSIRTIKLFKMSAPQVSIFSKIYLTVGLAAEMRLGMGYQSDLLISPSIKGKMFFFRYLCKANQNFHNFSRRLRLSSLQPNNRIRIFVVLFNSLNSWTTALRPVSNSIVDRSRYRTIFPTN